MKEVDLKYLLMKVLDSLTVARFVVTGLIVDNL